MVSEADACIYIWEFALLLLGCASSRMGQSKVAYEKTKQEGYKLLLIGYYYCFWSGRSPQTPCII